MPMTTSEALQYLKTKHGDRIISKSALDHCISSGIGTVFYRPMSRGPRFFLKADLDRRLADRLKPATASTPKVLKAAKATRLETVAPK
jgi:hypothetical protein